MLQTRNIQKLYNLSRSVINLSSQTNKKWYKARSYNKYKKKVQLTADLDNYKTAVDRLTQETSIAFNDENNISILKLFTLKNT